MTTPINTIKTGYKALRFWTEYKPETVFDAATGRPVPQFDAEGKPKMRAIDMVEYCAPGQGNRSTVVSSITALCKVRSLAEFPDNEAIVMANVRKDTILSQYNAWKRNEEVPTDGIPLAAWPGLSVSQANAFKSMGIRSVEEVAEASDSVIDKLPFSGGRVLRQSARDYLKSADRTKVAGEIGSLQTKNKELEEQLEEMRKIVLEMQSQQKRGPGRPRKEESEAA